MSTKKGPLISYLKHYEIGAGVWLGFSLACFLGAIFWEMRTPLEKTDCVIASCAENTLRMGNEEIHLGFYCTIEKSACPISKSECANPIHDTCRLETRLLSASDVRYFRISARNDCRYIEGRSYLGNESYQNPRLERDGFILLLLVVLTGAYLAYISSEIEKRMKDQSVEKKVD